MSAEPKKKNILFRIYDRIYEILASPLLWLGDRKPLTQKIIIFGFLIGMVILVLILHTFHTESSCKAKYDLCVQQYDACMEHSKYKVNH